MIECVLQAKGVENENSIVEPDGCLADEEVHGPLCVIRIVGRRFVAEQLINDSVDAIFLITSGRV